MNPLKDFNEKMKCTVIGLGFTMLFVSILSISSIYIYGSSVRSSVLDNLKSNRGNWLSTLMIALYNLVLINHLPYIFFAGRNALLIFIDECSNQSTSKMLQEKLDKARESED